MKKITIDLQMTVYKFKPENYLDYIPFAMDPKFKYHISFFNKREWYQKKRRTYTLEELKKFFATRKIICILYENNDVNIVMEGK